MLLRFVIAELMKSIICTPSKLKRSPLSRLLISLWQPILCLSMAELYVPAAESAAPEKGSSPSFDVSANFSFSSNGDLERGAEIGEVEVKHADIESGMTFRLFQEWRFRTGIFGSLTDLDHAGTVPLPDRLETAGLSLSATKFFGGEDANSWRATLVLRPGFFSEELGSSGSAFNVPGFLSIGKRISPRLAWDAGVRFDFKSQYEVIPMLGVVWDFHRDWTLSAGFPRTEIAYKLTPALTLKGGLRFQGGTYHIETAPAPGLGDTYLEYREIRVGGGFEWRINNSLSVTFDGGLVVDRRFDYFDRDYEMKGDSAAYLTIGITARF